MINPSGYPYNKDYIMSITITYLNSSKEPIDLEQTELPFEYCEIHTIDHVIKKQFFFEHQRPIHIIYRKDASETDQQILNNLSSLDVSILIVEHLSAGNKRAEKYACSDETGNILYKENYAFDENDENICMEFIDPETDKPEFERTFKFYYNKAIDPENEVFRGFYNEDGTLNYILYDPHSDQDSIGFGIDRGSEEDIPALCGYTGLTEEEIAYYLTADLLRAVIKSAIMSTIISYEDLWYQPIKWETINPEKDHYYKVFSLNGIILKKKNITEKSFVISSIIRISGKRRGRNQCGYERISWNGFPGCGATTGRRVFHRSRPCF